MATLPQNIGFGTEIEYVSRPSLTWLINRQTMRVQSRVEGLEAVRQAVEIILSVERFKWQIYTSRIGTELDDLIGEEAAYIESELPRMVTEALLVDDRVIEVTDFVSHVKDDTMTWAFTVNTVYGSYDTAIEV